MIILAVICMVLAVAFFFLCKAYFELNAEYKDQRKVLQNAKLNSEHLALYAQKIAQIDKMGNEQRDKIRRTDNDTLKALVDDIIAYNNNIILQNNSKH